jgi:hypothetical protein
MSMKNSSDTIGNRTCDTDVDTDIKKRVSNTKLQIKHYNRPCSESKDLSKKINSVIGERFESSPKAM